MYSGIQQKNLNIPETFFFIPKKRAIVPDYKKTRNIPVFMREIYRAGQNQGEKHEISGAQSRRQNMRDPSPSRRRVREKLRS